MEGVRGDGERTPRRRVSSSLLQTLLLVPSLCHRWKESAEPAHRWREGSSDGGQPHPPPHRGGCAAVPIGWPLAAMMTATLVGRRRVGGASNASGGLGGGGGGGPWSGRVGVHHLFLFPISSIFVRSLATSPPERWIGCTGATSPPSPRRRAVLPRWPSAPHRLGSRRRPWRKRRRRRSLLPWRSTPSSPRLASLNAVVASLLAASSSLVSSSLRVWHDRRSLPPI